MVSLTIVEILDPSCSMVLKSSLLIYHRTFVIILVRWLMFIWTLILKASISSLAVLLHSACA